MRVWLGLLGGAVVLLAASCGDDAGSSSEGGSSTSSGDPPNGASSSSSSGTSGASSSSGSSGASSSSSGGTPGSAAQLATKLRGKPEFLIGMGNDLAPNHDNDGAYTLGAKLDLHYAYLVGLQGKGGWPDWDPGGSFVNILSDSAKKHGTTPMYTVYGMRASGENNLTVLTDNDYMTRYWAGAKLLYQRIAIFGDPAVVHLEPDFWGFAQKGSADAKHAVLVTTLVPECAGVANLANDLGGLSRCLIKLGRQYAPKAAIGLHASAWSAADAKGIADYFALLGASDADFISVDLLDRDAGCFEAHVDPECQRGGTTGWYWDETNVTSPNFHDHLKWAKAIHDLTKLPIMWWQIPFGVPSTTPGGTAGHYRDNRVKYLFAHVDELVAAGGFAAAFGVGAGNQTYITTDGGQFKTAVAAYYAKPTVIP